MTAPTLHRPSSDLGESNSRAFRLSRRWDRTARLLGDEAMVRLARSR